MRGENERVLNAVERCREPFLN